MHLNFQNLATITALICFMLALIWLITQHKLLSIWGVNYSYSVGLVSRRSAALFLGIGVMFFLACDTQASQIRTAFGNGS